MASRRNLALASVAASLAVLLVASCAARTPIADVRARVADLYGKEITIAGAVTETLAVPLVGSRYYEVDDGTGTLWVETLSELPGKGAQVRSTGVLAPGIQVGTLEMGLMLKERRRR